MKQILRLAFILLVAASFSSCMKVVDIPRQEAVNPITGSWVVSAADENDGYSWQPFSPGFGNGVFDFYDHGSVQYNDGNITFAGNWYVTTTGNSYYDEYGNFYTGTHQSLETQMTDSYSGNTLNLYFDYIRFVNSNYFIVTYFDGKYIERVSFSRY